MAEKKIPDFSEAGWYLLYQTDLHYDPKKERYAVVKLIEPLSRESLEIQKRLARFWFARVHIFRHVASGLEGCEIRVFDRYPVARRWGPIGDRDIWAAAARIGERWQTRKNDDCEYGYDLSKDKKSIAGIEFHVCGALIKTYENPSKR